MPIPTVITDLNATAALNSPQGSDAPTEGDNYLRALSAFTRQNYDSISLEAANLASTSDAAKGPALVGLLESLAYPSATVGGFIRRLNPIRKYGVIVGDGTTDDAATFQAAAASGDKYIDARGLTCRIGSAVSIAAGQVWLLQGSTLNFTGTAATMFSASTVDNWALVGPFTISGDLVTNPGTGVSSKAISITDCGNWRVIEPTIKNVKGYGIYVAPGSSTRARGNGSAVTNPTIDACVWGWHDDPGSGSEYMTVTNIRATNNAQAGVETAAGNVSFIGGHVVDNLLDGVRVQNGANHAHGIFSGVNINHNPQYNIITSQVTNGQTFIGCHVYASSAGSSGAIFFDRSKGIHIQGGHLDCQLYNYKDGSSGLNIIEDAYCPGGYGIARLAGSNNGHDQLVLRGLWGPGAVAAAGGIDTTGVSLNDPALVYLIAERAAGSTQSLTSGVAATMLWPSTPPLPDRRATFTSTSTFTVPTGQGGLYRIEIDALFGGTSVSATGSFVEMKVNGTTKKVFLCTVFSTTKLQAAGAIDFYLSAADAVTFQATVVATTPTFGDSTWPSNFSARKLT